MVYHRLQCNQSKLLTAFKLSYQYSWPFSQYTFVKRRNPRLPEIIWALSCSSTMLLPSDFKCFLKYSSAIGWCTQEVDLTGKYKCTKSVRIFFVEKMVIATLLACKLFCWWMKYASGMYIITMFCMTSPQYSYYVHTYHKMWCYFDLIILWLLHAH